MHAFTHCVQIGVTSGNVVLVGLVELVGFWPNSSQWPSRLPSDTQIPLVNVAAPIVVLQERLQRHMWTFSHQILFELQLKNITVISEEQNQQRITSDKCTLFWPGECWHMLKMFLGFFEEIDISSTSINIPLRL